MNLDFAGGGIPAEVVPEPPFFSGGWPDVFDPFREPKRDDRRKKLTDLPPEEIKQAVETLQAFKIPEEAEQSEVLKVVSRALRAQLREPKQVKAAITALQLIEDELVALMLLGIDVPAHRRELTLAEFMLLLM